MQQAITVLVRDVVWFFFHQLLAAIPYKIVWSTLFIAIAGIYGATSRRSTGPYDDTNLILYIGIVVGAIALSILFVLFYLLMIVSNLPENQPTGEIRFTVDAEGIRIRSKDRDESFPWGRINDVGQNKFFLWVHADDKHYRFVPLRRLRDEAAASALWTSINSFRKASIDRP